VLVGAIAAFFAYSTSYDYNEFTRSLPEFLLAGYGTAFLVGLFFKEELLTLPGQEPSRRMGSSFAEVAYWVRPDDLPAPQQTRPSTPRRSAETPHTPKLPEDRTVNPIACIAAVGGAAALLITGMIIGMPAADRGEAQRNSSGPPISARR